MTPVLRTTALDAPVRPLPIPWRDPHTVPPAELERHIRDLEAACDENQKSPDLRTCLGMAYAMNFQVYQSMDTLEAARKLDGEHFWAQAKYAELLYRLRALDRAEEETQRALNLAGSMWELSVARKQLQEIRRLRREGTQKPAWTKSLKQPAWTLVLLMALLFSLTVLWK